MARKAAKTSRAKWCSRCVAIVRGGVDEKEPRLEVVEGFASSSAPGLAITPSVGGATLFGTWSITHCYSGRVLPALHFTKRADAARMAQRLAALGDWNQSQSALCRDREFCRRVADLVNARNTKLHELAASTPTGN